MDSTDMDLPQGGDPWGFAFSPASAPKLIPGLVEEGALPLPPHLHPRALRKGGQAIPFAGRTSDDIRGRRIFPVTNAKLKFVLRSLSQTQLSLYSLGVSA